ESDMSAHIASCATGNFSRLLPVGAKQPENDLGNAQRLQIYFGDKLRYVRDRGWHFWTGRRWEADGGREAAQVSAHKTSSLIADEAEQLQPTAKESGTIDDAAHAEQMMRELTETKFESGLGTVDSQFIRKLEQQSAAGCSVRKSLERRRQSRRRWGTSSG